MSLESVLHKIIEHLPLAPHEKDALAAEVTRETGAKPETTETETEENSHA